MLLRYEEKHSSQLVVLFNSPEVVKKKMLQDMQRTSNALCHVEHLETRGEKHLYTAAYYWLKF